jgi:methylated-DNA-protein-cysteine methyltransferase related protein
VERSRGRRGVGPTRYPPSMPEQAYDPAEYVEAVLATVESIPPGRVMSYGAIAEYLFPRFQRGSARRVGTIMAQYGGAVAWYRVVNGSGRFPPGHELKARRRLEAEGMVILGPRVSMARYAWWPDEQDQQAEPTPSPRRRQ